MGVVNVRSTTGLGAIQDEAGDIVTNLKNITTKKGETLTHSISTRWAKHGKLSLDGQLGLDPAGADSNGDYTAPMLVPGLTDLEEVSAWGDSSRLAFACLTSVFWASLWMMALPFHTARPRPVTMPRYSSSLCVCGARWSTRVWTSV